MIKYEAVHPTTLNVIIEQIKVDDDLEGFSFHMGGQDYRFLIREKTEHDNYSEYLYDQVIGKNVHKEFELIYETKRNMRNTMKNEMQEHGISADDFKKIADTVNGQDLPLNSFGYKINGTALKVDNSQNNLDDSIELPKLSQAANTKSQERFLKA